MAMSASIMTGLSDEDDDLKLIEKYESACELFSALLNNLYASLPPEGTLPTTDQISKKEEAKKQIIEKLFVPEEKASHWADKLLEAHKLLVDGCIDHKTALIDQAFEIINSEQLSPLSVLPQYKRAFLNVKNTGLRSSSGLKNVGLLGFVTQCGYLDIEQQLLEENADPNTRFYYDDALIFFQILKSYCGNYEKAREHVRLYLTHHFNINKTYRDRNILQYADTETGVPRYVAYFLAHKVVSLFETRNISDQKFIRFCEHLRFMGDLKKFYVIAKCYENRLGAKIYKDEVEESFYHLNALVDNLSAFCVYEIDRIGNDWLSHFSIVFTPEKKLEIEAIARALASFRVPTYHLCKANPDLIKQSKSDLEKLINRLELAFQLPRYSFLRSINGSGASASAPKTLNFWETFCRENSAELNCIKPTPIMKDVKAKEEWVEVSPQPTRS